MSSQTSFTFSEVKSCLYPSTLVEILNSLYGGSEGLEPGVCSVYAGTEAEMEARLSQLHGRRLSSETCGGNTDVLQTFKCNDLSLIHPPWGFQYLV